MKKIALYYIFFYIKDSFKIIYSSNECFVEKIEVSDLFSQRHFIQGSDH